MFNICFAVVAIAPSVYAEKASLIKKKNNRGVFFPPLKFLFHLRGLFFFPLIIHIMSYL